MGDLFGGGSKEANIQTVTPPTPQIPNMNEMNSVAYHRIMAGSPWLYSPYRAMDYFRNVQSTPNMQPQFGQQQMQSMGGGGMPQQGGMGGMQGGGGGGGLPSYPVGGNAIMGDFSQANSAMQSPQFSPLAHAMFQMLAPAYMQMMQGQGQPQQQGAPAQGGGGGGNQQVAAAIQPHAQTGGQT
jgi:hypothetical protein